MSAEGFARYEPSKTFATLAGRGDALAPDVLKEGALLGAIDLPEAEIVLVDGGHF